KKTSEERTAVDGTVQAARSRLRQVRDSVRREEGVALEARRNLASIRSDLENHQRRIAAMEAYSRWRSVRPRLDASGRETDGVQPALAEAVRRSADQAAVVTAREADAKAAESACLAADKIREEAEAALERERKTAASVDTAVAATQAALTLLP